MSARAPTRPDPSGSRDGGAVDGDAADLGNAADHGNVADQGNARAFELGNTSMQLQGALLGASAAAVATLLLVLVTLLAQQRIGRASVERYGSTLTSQLAALAATPVVTHDRIDLNVITTHLADDPAIVNAAIYTLDDRLMSSGGRVPAEATLDAAPDTVFKHDISFEAQRVGYVRVVIDPRALAADGSPLVWAAAALAIVLGAWIGARAGARLEQRLLALLQRLQSADATAPAPTTAATSTAASPALRNLQQLVMQLVPDPAPARPDWQAPASGAPPYLLLLNLFNQGSLVPSEREAFYHASQLRLQRVLGLYSGRVLRLHGTGLVALIDTIEADDHAFNAICAALLALRLTAALNDERAHQQRTQVRLRAGLRRLDASPPTGTDDALLDALDGPIADVLALSSTARDGALAIERSVFEDLLNNQRVLWSAIRSPIPRPDDPGYFHYQITGLTPSHASLLAGQSELLLAELGA